MYSYSLQVVCLLWTELAMMNLNRYREWPRNEGQVLQKVVLAKKYWAVFFSSSQIVYCISLSTVIFIDILIMTSVVAIRTFAIFVGSDIMKAFIVILIIIINVQMPLALFSKEQSLFF